MEAGELIYLTVRSQVEAVAYPPNSEPYLTQLLLSTSCSVLKLLVEMFTVGRLDASSEVYLICFTLADWAHLVFTSSINT
jgi:hypothetical protein